MFQVRWFLIAGLVALAAAFGACGGDDDDDGGDNNTPAAGSDAIDDYRAARAKVGDVTFKGEYELSGTAGGEGAEGTLTLYKDGNEKIRFDINTTVDGEDFEFIVISAGEESGFCLADAGELGALLGVAEGEGVCFADDAGAELGLADLVDDLKNLDEEDVEAADASTREIAGEQAFCATVTDDEDGSKSEECFSDEGIPLYVKTGEGEVLEATDVGGDPEDSDFELPYEVKELPGG